MQNLHLNRAWSREIDRRAVEQYGFHSLVHMENAGRGVVDRLMQLQAKGPFAILCGSGNNAGDGFVIARHLALRGFSATVLLLVDPQKLQGDAAQNYKILVHSEQPVIDLSGQEPERLRLKLSEQLQRAEWIIDAVLGTGATGKLRSPVDLMVQVVNQSSVKVLAVDLPTGFDCEESARTGQQVLQQDYAIKADQTCTFVTRKTEFLQPGAEYYLGEISVVDIGIPRKLIHEVWQDSQKSNRP